MTFAETISPGQIIVKDEKILRGLMERRFEPILVDIITASAREHGIVITESYREKRHMNDLHGTQPVRAVDLRSWCYPDHRAYEIMHQINTRWTYDPSRQKMQCAQIHNSGQGIHFHIQVHPATRRTGI